VRLTYDFYERPVTTVARELIGKKFVWNSFEGIITETEAYRGLDDAASHAARGMTPRSQIMFGPAGRIYVYFIYGMYHCLNIVTEGPGEPSAVLIRGIKLSTIHLNGPGKICRHLGINTSHTGLDITTQPTIYITRGIVPQQTLMTPRIGIKKATDKLWRFIMGPDELGC
jgi:DNA-3-methyladenine glycosylase